MKQELTFPYMVLYCNKTNKIYLLGFEKPESFRYKYYYETETDLTLYEETKGREEFEYLGDFNG